VAVVSISKDKVEESVAGLMTVKSTLPKEVITDFPKPMVKIEETDPKSSSEYKPAEKKTETPKISEKIKVVTTQVTKVEEIESKTDTVSQNKDVVSDSSSTVLKIEKTDETVNTQKIETEVVSDSKEKDDKKGNKKKQGKNKISKSKHKTPNEAEVDISVYTIKDGKLTVAPEQVATEIEPEPEKEQKIKNKNIKIRHDDIDVQIFEMGEEEIQPKSIANKKAKDSNDENRDVDVEVYDLKSFPRGKTKPVIESKRDQFAKKKNVTQQREQQKAAAEVKKQHIKKNHDNQKAVQQKQEKQPKLVSNRNENVEYRVWNGGKPQTQDKPKRQKVGSTAFLSKIGVSELPKARRLTAKQKLVPEVVKVLSAVDNFLSKDIYIDNTISMLVAVSGGVDSMTLLDVLAILSEKYYYSLQVAHYNHTLRGEDSFKDEEFVKATVENYGFEYFSARGDVRSYADKNKLSVEHAARTLRYNFFERTSRTNNSDFVATAHTADDSAETFLLNLMRGTGLTGLSGIPSKRNFVKNVVLVRPFISLTKQDVIAYAKARGLRWREDKSNATHDYTRNVIRNKLIPMITKEFNPNAIEAINRAAKLINGAEQNVTMQVEAALPSMIFDVRTERFSIKSNILMTFDEFMRGEILQYAISKHLRIQTLPMQKIDAIVNQIGKTSGKEIDIAPGMKAIYDRNTIILGKFESNVIGSVPISYTDFTDIDKYKLLFTRMDRKQVKFNRNPKIEFFDSEKLPDNLIVRPWKEGDFFSPLGMDGTMKVSDFLINEKVPNIDKPNVLVISAEDSDEVIWVCGYRINDAFKVTDRTRKALKGEYYTL
jgi:tRNA(Ile)-lysidine synthase